MRFLLDLNVHHVLLLELLARLDLLSVWEVVFRGPLDHNVSIFGWIEIREVVQNGSRQVLLLLYIYVCAISAGPNRIESSLDGLFNYAISTFSRRYNLFLLNQST